MRKYITIAKDPSIKVSSHVTEVMSPSVIYLPIHETDDLLITKRKVYKGDSLFTNGENPYFSPISGFIEKIVKRENGFGEVETYLQIKNDFQENDYYRGVENTTMMITTDIKKKIKDFFGKSQASLKSSESLILNTIEDEPYVANTSFLLKFYGREIILMLDAIATTYKIPSIQIVLKETDRDSIESLEEILNIYPNITTTILKDYYLLGKSEFLKSFLNLKENQMIFSPDELIRSYYEIFKLRKIDFLYVTFTGDAISNPQVFKVKVGTPIKDILGEVKFLVSEYDLITNGLLMGSICDENLIIDSSIRVIYAMKKNKWKESPCISCGKCNEVCPMNCNPYRSVQTKGKYKSEKCISCGLCTYVCPSHLFIENYTKGR